MGLFSVLRYFVMFANYISICLFISILFCYSIEVWDSSPQEGVN
jgi:hypothetical protein